MDLSTPKIWPSPGRKHIFGAHVLRAKVTCLVAANVVLFLLNEIQKLKQVWWFLNVAC